MAKDKSKFQLNKGVDHTFDISKGGKRKFDLRKDEDEPVVVAEKSTATHNPQPNEETIEKSSNGGKKWIWIILAIAIVAILIWMFLPDSKESSDEPVAIETEGVSSVETSEDTDSEMSTNDEVTIDEQEETSSMSSPSTDDSSHEASASQPAVPNIPNSNSISVSNELEQEALKVIRGDYGIGQERKNRLGDKYQPIQNRVNELKREGVF